MTAAGAKKHAEVIRKFGEGKVVQSLTTAGWQDLEEPHFDADREYRVKPEPRVPREWVISETTGKALEILPGSVVPFGSIRVREILPEENQ